MSEVIEKLKSEIIEEDYLTALSFIKKRMKEGVQSAGVYVQKKAAGSYSYGLMSGYYKVDSLFCLESTIERLKADGFKCEVGKEDSYVVCINISWPDLFDKQRLHMNQ